MFKFRFIKLTSLVLVAMVALAGCFGSPLNEVKETNETAINNVIDKFLGGIKNKDIAQVATVVADQITTNHFGFSVETISKAELLEGLQAEFEMMDVVHEVRLDNRVIVEESSDRVNIFGDYYLNVTWVFGPDDYQDEFNTFVHGSLIKREGKWFLDKLILLPYE